jgi:hypothetical protein
LRYVPDAKLGAVIEQTPVAGTTVAGGTSVNVVVARAAQLSDFTIGVYYDGADAEMTKLAERIVRVVRKAGGRGELSRPGADFFTGPRKAVRHEIRYGSSAEKKLAERLQQLLDSADFPPFELKPVRRPTAKFISIFLAPPAPLQMSSGAP